MKKKIAYFLMLLGFIWLASAARAAAPATLTLTNTVGDNVRVAVTGDPAQSIRLSFLPSGATSVTTIVFGTTDSQGNFSTSISSGGYGITPGSPVYVAVNGMQSPTRLWPSYTSSLTLSNTSINIAVGQHLTVTGSSALILASNGLNSIISTTITGSQITVTGLKIGSGTLSLCSANAGCNAISVTIGSEGETQVTFSQNNFTIYGGERKEVDIYGGAPDGYQIITNSNPNAVDASIRARGDLVVLYAGDSLGTAVINICSKNVTSNCANLNVSSASSTANTLAFSQNDITLNPGLTQNVTISGGPDNSYYISANSNSGAVTASLSGNLLTLIGGGNAGSSVIAVCSASLNATCGNINVTLDINSTTASPTTLSFSQNVVSVSKNDTTNVTVSGGNGTGYVLSANSNPSAATANLTGNSNIIAVYGVDVGSSIVTVCSATGSICSSIYVSVGPEMAAIYFSQNNVTLTPGNKSIVGITGGTGTGKVISLNSNPKAVSAILSSDGKALVLSGGTVSGTAAITVCSATYSNNCSSLNASFTAPASAATGNSAADTAETPTPLSTQDQIEKISAEAATISTYDIENITAQVGAIRNSQTEASTMVKYTAPLVSGLTAVTEKNKDPINSFIAYGTPTTKVLGAGERAGVLNSYRAAFGKVPTTATEWADVIKIANGRWPGETSAAVVASAKVEFKKVYKREANLSNQNDNAAIAIIAYGLRPTARNTASENSAIKTFKSVYGHNPVSPLAWDIVRAVAYSGAKR